MPDRSALLRVAVGHEHGTGALVRDPGGPGVVRAQLRLRGARAHLFELDPRYPEVGEESRQQLLTYRAALEPEGSGG
jgi:hypothetical protein